MVQRGAKVPRCQGGAENRLVLANIYDAKVVRRVSLQHPIYLYTTQGSIERGLLAKAGQ